MLRCRGERWWRSTFIASNGEHDERAVDRRQYPGRSVQREIPTIRASCLLDLPRARQEMSTNAWHFWTEQGRFLALEWELGIRPKCLGVKHQKPHQSDRGTNRWPCLDHR